MKIVLLVISALIIIILVAFIALGFYSQSGKPNGMIEGKLTKCSDKPNCICTEFETDASHFLEPIRYSEAGAVEVLQQLSQSIQQMGGEVKTEKSDYLAATFTSSVFKFVDDLEIRIDVGQKLIHLRSASRVGYSDRGVNQKRLERLKGLLSVEFPVF